MNESEATTSANAVRRGIYANLKVYDGNGHFAYTVTREHGDTVIANWKQWKVSGEPPEGRFATIDAIIDRCERGREVMTLDLSGIVAISLSDR